MTVWCFIMVKVFIDGSWVLTETAAQGKLISKTNAYVTVDFSEYAAEKGYVGDYSRVEIDADKCLEPE